MTDSAQVSIEQVELNPDLHALLLEIGPGLRGRQVLLTPHIVREGRTHYSTDDVYDEAIARDVGLDTEFALAPADRTWIGEYSAVDIVTTLSMTVGSGLTVAALTALGRYIKERFKLAGSHTNIPGLPEKHVRVVLNRIHDRDGLPIIDSAEFTGRPNDVVDTINELLSPHVVEQPQTPSTATAKDTPSELDPPASPKPS